MYNKVILIGNLTRDIELKYIPSGLAVAKGAIATSYKFKKQDETMFLDFTLFGKSAEIFNQYTKKGSKIMLEGRLKLEQWQDQQGQNRSKHALSVDTFKFLDAKQDNQAQAPQNNNYNQGQTYNAPQQNQQAYNNTPNQTPNVDVNEDEIPF